MVDYTDKASGSSSDMASNTGLAKEKVKAVGGKKKTPINLKPKLTVSEARKLTALVKKKMKEHNQATSSNGPVSSSDLFAETLMLRMKVKRPEVKKPRVSHTPARPTQNLSSEGVDKNDPMNRLMGTDSLVKIYRDDTPGQGVDEQKGNEESGAMKTVNVNGQTYMMVKGKKGWQMSDLQKKHKEIPSYRLLPGTDLSKLFNINLVKETPIITLVRKVQNQLFGEGDIAPNPGGVKMPQQNRLGVRNTSSVGLRPNNSVGLKQGKKPGFTGFKGFPKSPQQQQNEEFPTAFPSRTIQRFKTWKNKGRFQWGRKDRNVGSNIGDNVGLQQTMKPKGL